MADDESTNTTPPPPQARVKRVTRPPLPPQERRREVAVGLKPAAYERARSIAFRGGSTFSNFAARVLVLACDRLEEQVAGRELTSEEFERLIESVFRRRYRRRANHEEAAAK